MVLLTGEPVRRTMETRLTSEEAPWRLLTGRFKVIVTSLRSTSANIVFFFSDINLLLILIECV